MIGFNKFNPGNRVVRYDKPRFKSPKADRAKEIKALLDEGMTSEEIGDALGIKASTVRSYIKDYGLKP